MWFDINSIPVEWNVTNIGGCCEVLDHMRIPISAEKRLYRQGNVPYYGANGQQGWIDKYIFDEELVLIAEDGGNFDDYIDKAIAYMIRGKSWVNNHAHILRAKENTMNLWLLYNLAHRDIRFYIQGGTRAKLNQSELRSIEIVLPPLSEQRQIINLLATLDSQIQRTKQLIAKLKQQREGLLHDLLTRGLDEDGELRDPDAYPELFKDSVLGRIPKEWEIKPLKELTKCPITDFGSFSMTNLLDFRDSGIPFLKTEAIHDYGIDQSQLTFISEEVHKQLPQSVVHEGDLLFTKIGAIGRVCVYDGSLGECNSNAASAKIRLDVNRVNSHYIAHYLRSNTVKRQYLKEIISTPPRINLGQINEWYIPIPSLKEQLAIVAVLETLRADTSAESSYLAKLKQYKQGLMHDLLTGRVRVGEEGAFRA